MGYDYVAAAPPFFLVFALLWTCSLVAVVSGGQQAGRQAGRGRKEGRLTFFVLVARGGGGGGPCGLYKVDPMGRWLCFAAFPAFRPSLFLLASFIRRDASRGREGCFGDAWCM